MSAKLLTSYDDKPNRTSIRCWNLKVDNEYDGPGGATGPTGPTGPATPLPPPTTQIISAEVYTNTDLFNPIGSIDLLYIKTGSLCAIRYANDVNLYFPYDSDVNCLYIKYSPLYSPYEGIDQFLLPFISGLTEDNGSQGNTPQDYFTDFFNEPSLGRVIRLRRYSNGIGGRLQTSVNFIGMYYNPNTDISLNMVYLLQNP